MKVQPPAQQFPAEHRVRRSGKPVACRVEVEKPHMGTSTREFHKEKSNPQLTLANMELSCFPEP